jgi:UDP-N-acetylglucosamine 1-carboxyvinyltransferase
MLTVLGTGGHIFLEDAPIRHMKALIDLAEAMDAEVSVCDKGIAVLAESVPKTVPYLETGVYPLFPTDMQSPLLAVLTKARGQSIISETIFENRMRIVPELLKMGADITVTGNVATVTGALTLVGTSVKAMELRGGAALVIAGCMAEGETIIENRHFIDRGYEDIVRDYQNLGVKINAGIRTGA